MSTEQSPGEQPEPHQPGETPAPAAPAAAEESSPPPAAPAAAEESSPDQSSPNQSASGSVPPPLPHPQRVPQRGDFFGWVRGLGVVRGGDRWMGGVASGIAHRWGVDPILVRGLFIVAAIFLGVGVLAYGILWLLLPEPDGRIHAQEAAHGRWTAGMTGGLIVTILGLGGARAGFLFGERGIGGAFWGLFWIALIAFGIYSVVRGGRRRAGYRHTAPHGAPEGVPAGGAAGQSDQPGQHAPHAPGPASQGAPSESGAPGFQGGVPGGSDAFYAKPGTPPSYGAPSAPYAAGHGPSSYGSAQPAPPYYGGSLPPVPAPAPPRPPRRRGPSAPYVLVVLGIAALTAGALGTLVATGVITLAAGAVWSIVAVVLGLGILVSGLRGRTAGILTLFAVVALVTAAVSQSVDRFANVRPQQIALAPGTVQEATKGYDITASKGTLDLGALDNAGPLASETVVPVKVTLSDLAITVPKDIPVQVRSSATLADVRANGQDSTGISRHDTTTYNSGRTGQPLVVELDATLASVTITEEH